ncbi:hypothetical protein ACP8HI_16560 [Paenibacillus sp. FA6]|uniref:hypothetical protein n=1 Tax=Paenibacillus sp. FA6 TaxID=3413029 RepID=UPI003F65772E
MMNSVLSAVTKNDKQATKALLRDYPKMCQMVTGLSYKQELTLQEQQVSKAYKHLVEHVQLAHSLILDDEVKRIIDHRYFKSRSYVLTSIQFRSIMSERTVDRRLEKGITMITESLKLWGVI